MNDLNNAGLADQSKARSVSEGTPEFDNAMAVAGEVFKLVEQHRTPPVPKTYEVLYAYASSAHREVSERIKSVVDSGNTLSPYDIVQIHQDCLTSNELETCGDLDKEMKEVLSLVESYLSSSEEYAGSLTLTVDQLTDVAKPAQIKKTVELLISENEKMRAETETLTANLEQSKSQIEEMHKSLAEARENGLRDPLTNLANRRRFEQYMASAVEEAHSEEQPLCLVMGDIDHFKTVNDTFGHIVGDGVLKYFAMLLTRNVKGRDLVARYGGEEFAIVLPRTTLRDAKTLTEQIRLELESTKLVVKDGGRPLGKITSSFGVALLTPSEDGESLLQRADAKLYEAKNTGRNRVVCDEF